MASLSNASGSGLLKYFKHPSSVTINGDLLQYETNIALGEDAYIYTLAYDTNNFNAPISSVIWDVIAPNDIATIDSQTNTQCGLRINTITSEYVKITITVTVTFATNKLLSADIVIGVQLPGCPVDLGLPSGLLWRNTNLGASSPQEYGDYFAWGETTGYANAAARNAAMNANYPDLVEQDGEFTGGFDTRSYAATGANKINKNLALDTDAAYVNLGGNWKIPSGANYSEIFGLKLSTTSWSKLKGVPGVIFTGNNGNRIFLPQTGAGFDGNSIGFGSLGGFYWLSNNNASVAYFFRNAPWQGNYSTWGVHKRCGLSLRPVMAPSE